MASCCADSASVLERGTSIDPEVWSAGGIPKRRKVVHAVGNGAFLPGPAGLWDGESVAVAATPVTCHDIEAWPYSVSMFVKWVAFLDTLRWPQGRVDLGVGGVSFVEVLIFDELWAGERLSLEKAVPRYRRACRSISVSAVLSGPGTDIWRSCRFICAMMRSLCLLLGGLERFVPCSFGANHCRLRHIGWEKCGHGVTSRPRSAALEGFLSLLLLLFRYPPRSAAALLGGVLPLRYCKGRFACKVPTWDLPVHGQVAGLITDVVNDALELRDGMGDRAELPRLFGDSGVHCEGRLLGALKEFG